ncbi:MULTISPECIES: hypothetical protein [unclassified Pseudofrankia]|uniref:hypothetical protein n=1 Tax=unclassified Pseudofrankia TaxID=2994372 RepID=UPI0008DB16EC|nr:MULTISPECIES: hypothetical protein [unclassified Pseudofrankia]MDT3445724.1 hypothetical protein [Pseudofrankia sp. BMG5.37]OHV42469.1 hypothetical protein BCD48_31320 [Pseudofrankia sp. BMG5.36]
MGSIPAPHDQPGWPRRREPARLVALGGGRLGLALHTGARGRDLTELARLIDDALYVDHARPEHGGTSVVLIFQDQAPEVSPPSPVHSRSGVAPTASAEAATIPGGWVPDVGTAVGPDRGISPHQLAVWELLTAAPDGASGARLVDAVTRLLPPETVVVLADLLRDRRDGRDGRDGRGECCDRRA